VWHNNSHYLYNRFGVYYYSRRIPIDIQEVSKTLLRPKDLRYILNIYYHSHIYSDFEGTGKAHCPHIQEYNRTQKITKKIYT